MLFLKTNSTMPSRGLLNCGLRVAGHRLHCGLRVAGHRLRAAGCGSHSDCGLRATDCGLLTNVLRAAGHMLWIAKIAGC